MPFSSESRGFDEQGRRIRHIVEGLERQDALLELVGFDLAKLWKANIDAGPNERWEAGASRRVQKFGGTTLRDRGKMQRSIVGLQTGPFELSVGSDLTVGNGWNLLSIHEFGADVKAQTAPWLTFRYPLGAFADDGWACKKQIRIPRRPTAPFDWDTQQLTPDAAALAQTDINNCLAELHQ